VIRFRNDDSVEQGLKGVGGIGSRSGRSNLSESDKFRALIAHVRDCGISEKSNIGSDETADGYVKILLPLKQTGYESDLRSKESGGVEMERFELGVFDSKRREETVEDSKCPPLHVI